MNHAILVLNAGSSSIRFSLFAVRGVDLELAARGEIEELHSDPRFVTKNGAGEIVKEKSWGEGATLGHEGALRIPERLLARPAGETRAVGPASAPPLRAPPPG
jgi:acetate kinase